MENMCLPTEEEAAAAAPDVTTRRRYTRSMHMGRPKRNFPKKLIFKELIDLFPNEDEAYRRAALL